MANILTTRARVNFSSNREMLDFAEGIALLDPNENPFTLATMKFNTKNTGNIKHSWLFDELVPESDTVNGAATTAETALTMDNVTYIATGDVLRLNASNETVLVTGISTNTLTVIRDYGATSGAYTALAATVADGAYVTIIGNAFEAGHQLPTEKSTKEIQIDNFCQDQRTPFGVTEVAAAAAVRGEDDWPYQMKKSGITHMRKVEYQNFWGHPMPGDLGLSSSGTGNSDPAAAAGIMHYLTGGTGFSGTGSDRILEQTELTESEFRNWLKFAFRYGSRDKVLFAAPIIRDGFDLWGISKLQTVVADNVMGMNVLKWQSSHGNITIITHKMLEDPGSDGAYAFLLDMEDVSWLNYSHLGSTRLRNLDPYRATGKTKKQAEWQTIGCLEIKTPQKHAVIKGVTSVAA